MGKGAILLVLVSLFSWTVTHSTRQKTFLETQDEQAMYGERVLAREAALSGFNSVVALTEGDFTGFRTESTTSAYKDGSFTISSVPGAGDTMLVSATGRVGRADYTISADMIYKIRSKLAALNIDGPVKFSNGIGLSYGIHGQDKRPGDPDGVFTGKGAWANGVHSILKSADEAMQSGLDASLVTGGLYGRDGSFVNGEMEMELDNLEREIQAGCTKTGPRCFIYEGNQTFKGGDVFGSPDKPVTLIVHGDVTFRGSVQGYGVLYLNGNFATEVGQPKWEGLVYASKAGGDHELRGEPSIYGAVIFRSENPDDQMSAQDGEAEAALDPISVTMRGEPKIYYSSEALAKAGILVPDLAFDPPEGFLLNLRQTSSDRTDITTEDLTQIDQQVVDPTNVF
jgi:hypothetical protein